MTLRKSLVKASDAAEYIELFGSSTRDRHARCINVFFLRMSTDISTIVHDDLGWKNQTTLCNRFWRAGCSRLEYVGIHLVC